jgi:hypothetical protein
MVVLLYSWHGILSDQERRQTSYVGVDARMLSEFCHESDQVVVLLVAFDVLWQRPGRRGALRVAHAPWCF